MTIKTIKTIKPASDGDPIAFAAPLVKPDAVLSAAVGAVKAGTDTEPAPKVAPKPERTMDAVRAEIKTANDDWLDADFRLSKLTEEGLMLTPMADAAANALRIEHQHAVSAAWRAHFAHLSHLRAEYLATITAAGLRPPKPAACPECGCTPQTIAPGDTCACHKTASSKR